MRRGRPRRAPSFCRFDPIFQCPDCRVGRHALTVNGGKREGRGIALQEQSAFWTRAPGTECARRSICCRLCILDDVYAVHSSSSNALMMGDMRAEEKTAVYCEWATALGPTRLPQSHVYYS